MLVGKVSKTAGHCVVFKAMRTCESVCKACIHLVWYTHD